MLSTFEVSLAEKAADEEMVDNGTMKVGTIVQRYAYTQDQSVSGVGFASVYGDLSNVDPDGSRSLNLKFLPVVVDYTGVTLQYIS